MTARAQRDATAYRLRQARDTTVTELVEDFQASEGMMHYRQGYIAGLKRAEDLGEEAFKAVGE